MMGRTLVACALLVVSEGAAPAFAGSPDAPPSTSVQGHRIVVREGLLTPEDGLLLGNGDLSVSVYQSADRILWRFGKGDVWDRRLDLSDDPKPAHIREIERGIAVEGWKCPPYGGPVEATRGTSDPKRMRELCQGTPPSYTKRPFPCPKPVGELALQLPPDQMGLRIEQTLDIERATLRISCRWETGVGVDVECFVPPRANVLVVRWKIAGWDDVTQTGHDVPPVWFSLYRWADPSPAAFAQQFQAHYRHGGFVMPEHRNITPLPRPQVITLDGRRAVEQAFPADPLFEKGFRYWLVPFAQGCAVEPVDLSATGEARLHIMPESKSSSGCLIVAVPSSREGRGPDEELGRLAKAIGSTPAAAADAWAADNLAQAAAFWSKSSVRVAEPLAENLWYETLHARRCTTRADTVPPGLFLPSTVQDYSHWHGDYHLNYNLQEPFWGDYTANHLELGDAYFQAMSYLLQIGRKIARDYYGTRGVFIQLSGYPVLAADDYLGVAPMGRMAYMTGWGMNQYWWRYLVTLDADWLRSTGYPVIRDCALFYTDFLRKGSDGLYHAFPSNQGEDGFTGNPKDYTDRRQILQHARYCLRAAVRASEVLGSDPELRARWRDIVDHCAGDDGTSPSKLAGLEREAEILNPPEFGPGRPYRRQPDRYDGPPGSPNPTSWYFGQYPWSVLQSLRAGDFLAARDFPTFVNCVRRWRHPNGLVWGMAIANYGHAGAWTESLGAAAPLQEMMLQSWDRALRIFPAWPAKVDARFESFRAEGAFLVTASWKNGRVDDLAIRSERGAVCRLYSPWPGGFRVVDGAGASVAVGSDAFGRPQFETRPGVLYRVSPAEPGVSKK